MDDKVYLIDEVAVQPGQARAFLKAYRERYVPGAQARGMQLEHTWVSPPVWLDERSNTVTVVWSVSGAGGFWQMSFQGRQDSSLEAWWWHEAAPMIVSRQRYAVSDAGAVDTLCEV